MKKLLIVESPTKARTIGHMLNTDYEVIASMGHVRDLPERTLGVNVEHDFAPEYVDTPRSGKIVAQLQKAAKAADEIYLATDPDREGEAIAWHLQEVLKPNCPNKEFNRVTFHEITREAIQRALSERGKINQNVVDSQQARRILDRLVGYRVSPLLWSKVEKGISAGRVQSVALRLIVEREREIAAFVPQEYWNFALQLHTAQKQQFKAQLTKIDNKKFEITSAEAATATLVAIVKGGAPTVGEVGKSEKKRTAMPPFTTSTLQQTASSALHFSPSSTMQYAQSLYEGVDIGQGGVVGLITYMRTDSVTIAREAQAAAAAFIKEKYGEEYAPVKYNFYKNKSSAQEAHEAIRPTDVRRTPEQVAKFLTDQQLKLYTLIWKRFVASQMAPCRVHQVSVDLSVAGFDGKSYTFHAGATVPVFAGFTAVWGRTSDEEELGNSEVLEKIKKGEVLTIAKSLKEQKFTEPAPHFSEASLIKELEDNGIGRPSTYAAIIKTIQSRNYVQREKGQLKPTTLGYQVNDFLVGHLPQLFEVGFTADMEGKLDKIELGSLGWIQMLRNFYDQFEVWLGGARDSDAAGSDESRALMGWLGKLEFKTPAGANGRKGGDGKFFTSVKNKFDRDGKLTGKQYAALLNMAAKYQAELAAVPEILQADFKKTLAEFEQRKATAAANELSASEQKEYQQIFAAFKQVEFVAPRPVRGRAFDEKGFVQSLATQLKNGKGFSDKQVAVLKKLVQKYAAELPDGANIMQFLGVSAVSEQAPASAPKPEIEQYLNHLGKVTKWAEPVKRGRFTFDDKLFFQSLLKQYQSGRTLSDKQVAALQKLAGKY